MASRPSRSHRGGRHRPHVNAIVDLAVLEGRSGQAQLLDGAVLDTPTIQRLLCDSGVHRVVTAGRASILDYGTTTPSHIATFDGVPMVWVYQRPQ